MNTSPIIFDPKLAVDVADKVERASGRECHVVVIVCALVNGQLGEPSFATSLQPREMEDLIRQVADYIPQAGEKVITGIHHREGEAND